MQPVSFSLLIKRNLSSAWYSQIPDIDMSGRLKKINLLLSQGDYAMIMTTLDENLGETIEDNVAKNPVARSNKKIQEEPAKSIVCK